MKWIKALVSAFSCMGLAFSALAEARPDLVERAKRGDLAEVRVSWWGFVKADSTRFIAAALSSGAKKVVFDRVAGPWQTLPLTVEGRNGIEIFFEPGVELVAKRGGFKDVRDALLTVCNSRGVKVSGRGAALRMWRGVKRITRHNRRQDAT